MSNYIVGNGIGECGHNKRTRYEHGFYCNECNTFFDKDSPTYRSDELLSSVWMVLSNLNYGKRGTKLFRKDAEDMMNKIGIGKKHNNFEELLSEAKIIINKYGADEDSASMIL